MCHLNCVVVDLDNRSNRFTTEYIATMGRSKFVYDKVAVV